MVGRAWGAAAPPTTCLRSGAVIAFTVSSFNISLAGVLVFFIQTAYHGTLLSKARSGDLRQISMTVIRSFQYVI